MPKQWIGNPSSPRLEFNLVPADDFERSGNSGRRQVWLLTITGLTAGAITLTVVGAAQFYIGSEEGVQDKSRSQLTAIAAALEATDTAERQDLFALLSNQELPSLYDAEKVNDIDQWRQLAAHFADDEDSKSEVALDDSFARAAKAISELESIRARANDWHTNYRDTLAKLDACGSQTRARIEALRSHMIQLEGAGRLAIATKLRRLSDADKSQIAELAPDVIEAFRIQSKITLARRELSELAVYVEQLCSVRRRDALTDLMDNNIKPCLSRLGAVLLDAESTTVLSALEDRLLGAGFVIDEAHQTVTPGQSGLYGTRRDVFDLEEQRSQLTTQLRDNLNLLRVAIDEVDRKSQMLSQQLASESEDALSLAWIFLSGVALLCATVFVLLARNIARTLTEQIHAIGLRTKELARSQKFESIGQMAAGIADEITAPLKRAMEHIEVVGKASGKMLELAKTLQRHLPETISAGNWEQRKRELQTLTDRHQQERVPEQLTAAIAASRDYISHAVNIAQALRHFSKPTSLEKAPTDLNAAVRNTVVITANSWKYVACLRTDLDENLPHVVCQPAEINQLLLNLVVNAADAVAEKMKAGSRDPGLIVIRTRTSDGDALIEVEDTGCGIAADIRERIFDPFFTTKAAGHGGGMGLTICYNIVVNVHGGRIEVESSPGIGSLFRVTLPTDGEGHTPMDEGAAQWPHDRATEAELIGV
jgi:signal transduction histidine kinase